MQSSELFHYYLTMNVNNICRICLEKSTVQHKLTPIFDPVKPPHFSNLIMACAQVEVVEGDGLPPLICNKCIARLNVAYQFKTQCESSDIKLRQYFNAVQLPPTPDLSNFTLDIKEDAIGFHELQPIQEVEEELKQQEQQIQQQQQQQQAQELIDTSDQLHRPVLLLQQTELQTQEPVLEASTSDNIKEEESIDSELNLNEKSKLMKRHQCDTCGKVFRTKPSLIHHIRIHTGERPYLCHLCDKSFINGGHLHTHMRTHTGEKNHVCSACSKAFATAQQLTKHTIAIHTSERPYACTYCPKRFASSSNLNTHTKIHTGEKNYHCDQCGKTFSTKGQLYQHMLVHTGEKAFLCEFCHKRFSQKAHLIRHLKMHK